MDILNIYSEKYLITILARIILIIIVHGIFLCVNSKI